MKKKKMLGREPPFHKFWTQTHTLPSPTPSTLPAAMTIFPSVKYTLEHRWKTDDAWYTCGVILEDGKHLRVKFEEEEGSSASTENDEVFSISDFSNQEQIDAFRNKFRPVSAPIEDNECAKVIQGITVCAAYSDDGNYRYFDAVVDAVCYKEHSPEKCVCKYLLFWKHGPGEGNITKTNLQDICLIRHGVVDVVDPILADFTKLVKEKLKGEFSQFILIPKSSSFLSKSNETSDKSQEFGSAGQNSQVGFHEGKGRFWSELIDQERDVGGLEEIGCHHYLILENLEKDVYPNLMIEFIHQQTSIAIHAFVFPSLSVETYARGAVVVDSRSKLKRIYEFVSNPNHFIISSSGRPWVIAEDTFWTGTFDINLQSLQPKFEKKNTGSELTVVWTGTKQYMTAKRLHGLYMEFRSHLNGLQQRLGMEEEKEKEKEDRHRPKKV